MKVAAKLGEICVEIFRVKKLGHRNKKSKRVSKEIVSEIAEKAIKGRALTHGTT